MTASLLTIPQARADADLTQLSIEDLMQVQVTSVSKRSEAAGQAPASIYVITPDDIRRSGALSLPEALRLAPSLTVQRVDALDYSITARGFSGMESANKLLVLIDGRSVYTPTSSGVEWDAQHVLLDDVDRIEVNSGPGGVLFGANAVNGVVDVRTKSAYETQGLLASIAAGTLASDARLRIGGVVGSAAFRVFATAYGRGELENSRPDDATKGWDGVMGGFRVDWAGESRKVTVQGDAYENNIDDSFGIAGGVEGANLLARFTQDLAGGDAIEIQAYADHTRRKARLVYDALDTYDVQFQHSLAERGRHQLTWGAGLRRTKDAFRTLMEPQLLSPPSRRTTISNIFVQDRVRLARRLDLTLGLKLEDNTYTRSEWLPSGRLAWRPDDKSVVWASASRAVRNPSRIERDFFIDGLVVPGRFGSEKLTAYEVGYRAQPLANFAFSATGYHHRYDELRTNDLTAPGVLPIFVSNTMRATITGLEGWADWDVTPWWRLSPGLNLLEKDVRLKPGSLDIADFEGAGADPSFGVKLRSQMRFDDRFEIDANLRWSDETPKLEADGYVGAPAYVEADLRVAWRLNEQVELAAIGKNLLHDNHAEASEARRNLIPRSAVISLRWTY